MKKYFRVQQRSTDKESGYDTTLINYGNDFDTIKYLHFMHVYDAIMVKINLPVDFLITVTNQICMLGEVYMEVLGKSIDNNGLLHLYQVTNNQKHQGFTMPVQLLNDFLQRFDEENQFIFFDNGTILWEYYFEKVRAEEFNYLPARLDSVFFFDNLNDCNKYKQNYLNGIGTSFVVDILETRSVFEGDMFIIDEIDNSISRDELLEQVRKYWRGEKTENPITEIVFQGKYNLVDV